MRGLGTGPGFDPRASALVAGVFVVACLALPALAQETREFELPDLEEPPGISDRLEWRVTLANRFVGDSDFGSFDGSSDQPEGRVRLQVPFSEDTVMRIIARGRFQIWDFDGVSNLFGTGPTTDAPFDSLNSVTLRFQGAHLLPEKWTLFSDEERWAAVVQGTARGSWESGSSFSDGLRGGGSVAVFYRLKERLEVLVGVRLGSRLLRSGIAVAPLLEFDWRINDDWRLRSYGLGLQLERSLAKSLAVFVRARLENSGFRLDDRGGTIGKGGVRIRQLPAGLGIHWRPLPSLRVQLIAGAVAYNQIRIKNEDDQTIGKASGGPAPYVTVRLDWLP